ncbi:MAG: hypothetical protein J7K75_12530 [Desulfuromonas sp.]|nr:hypothetical protein [Desulfuromonas sp.]
MNEEQEKYTVCDQCGAHILEKCAYEEDDFTLCGDCVVKQTNKEVKQAETIVNELRQEVSEQQKKEAQKQYRHRTALIFVICLLIFIAVQAFVYYSKPEPVASQKIDPQQNIYVTQSLILLAIHNYQKDHPQPPKTLKQLVPDYLPSVFARSFSQFSYHLEADLTPVLTLLETNKKEETTEGKAQ